MPDINMMGSAPRPNPDDREAAMARADLYKLANYSTKLFKMIQDGDQLEGWVQAKITKSADYIASVYHFMEYEMKFSEYGERLETADMYSESVKREFKRKLTEAKVKLEKLKEKNQKDLGEGWEDMMAANKKAASEKGTGKFDKKKTYTGTQYTRKASTFTDGGDDSDTKKAKAKAKKTTEGIDNLSTGEQMARDGFTYTGNEREMIGQIAKYMRDRGDNPRHIRYYMNDDDFIGDTLSDLRSASSKKSSVRKTDEGIKDIAKKAMGAVKKAGSKALDTLGHGSDEDMIKDLQKKTGMPQTGKKPMATQNEALKGGQKKLDMDKDGKLEKSDFAKLRSANPKDMPAKGEKIGKEGNAFGKAVRDAKASGDKTVTVGGKTMPVKESERTMSRAAKGHEKYGKEGMAALAKAGKEGKSLDPVRKKYDKYDEAAKPDFLDMDKDGDTKEPMKKAIADKKAAPKKGVNPFAKK
jgi:hypothetical protein